MERPSKLADLRLVNKYYPPVGVGVANYSYPSPKLDAMSQCEQRPVGRSSVGSEASVPDMVDDGESVMSAGEDDRSFYRDSGAELWDKFFWEDPFWEANAEEAEREADRNSITQRILSRNACYPALIPSPEEKHKKQYFLDHGLGDTKVPPETDASFVWPLAVADPPASPPRPVTPKVSYSLFPRQMPTPPKMLSLSPAKPSVTPRSISLWGSPTFNDSTASLTSLGRSSRVRKARSDVPIAKGRSSWATQSAVVPTAAIPSPPAFDSATRRDSSQSINLRQRFPVRPARTRSDTLMSQSSITSAPRLSIIDISAKDATQPHLPISQFPIPPRSPPRIISSGRHSQPEARKLPPPLQLHRCTTETELPSSHHRQSRITSHVYAHTNPSTPSMPAHPHPMPVSFFDVDSDSDEEETSFARRIARSFTSQVRTRSASAAPRSRKGQEVAKQQLRRARAETVGSPSEEGTTTATPVDDKASRDSRPPLLRKQRSEVFGKIFWNRR